MNSKELSRYRKVQDVARRTLRTLSLVIREGMSEEFIAREAKLLMGNEGVTQFWYHGVPALVLVGERTPLSLSGRDYKPTDVQVKRDDLVTVDVSPEIDGYWGDYARSFVVCEGRVVNFSDSLWGDAPLKENIPHAVYFEDELHERLLEIARPRMTFDGLYEVMSHVIREHGFLNLDFRSNLGHSIERKLEDRVYVEKNNCRRLEDVALFTFEPHITPHYDTGGFKREDIYYFERGKLKRL